VCKIFKSALIILPSGLKRFIVLSRDYLWYWYAKVWEMTQSFPIVELPPNPEKTKKRILVYAVYGLRHAGTERNLQHIANSLADDYDVFYMYGIEVATEERASILHERITLIPFSYSENEQAVPHLLHDMSPHLSTVVRSYAIDCLITASPGYSHYPWNVVRGIPIILLNIFGAPTLQPNVRKVIYNSTTTREHAERWIGPDPRGVVAYAPLFAAPLENTRALGQDLRSHLGIPASDFVFGRIGRADNGIFDPIGIRAWQRIVDQYPQAHYLIMSPPPVLREIVEKERIPQVHFLPPSSREEDVWAFHGALDAMAHFRLDGETSGVAIAESLTIGNPVISHRSHMWNAHAGYLTEPHGIVVAKDDVAAYARAMEQYIADRYHTEEKWNERKQRAEAVGREHFSAAAYRTFIRKIVADTI